MKKRMIALALSVLMLLSLIPLQTLADGGISCPGIRMPIQAMATIPRSAVKRFSII